MYALISDIESYPEFLPWCQSTRILSRNGDEIHVHIEMSKGGIRKSFTTWNRLQENEMIEMHLLEGPFQRFEGVWRFQTLRSDACKVSLTMDFEFSSHLLHTAFTPALSQMTDSIIDSFCSRAEAIYGKR
jgi:ribosome-associated toxin RatA of RatAB toxin-antitoxin module